MKKNGFTLIELIGVAIILSIIALLAFPPILDQIRKTKNNLSGATTEIIFGSASLYVDKYKNIYSKSEGNKYCLTLQDLVNENLLASPITDVVSGSEIPLNKKIEIIVNNNNYE